MSALISLMWPANVTRPLDRRRCASPSSGRRLVRYCGYHRGITTAFAGAAGSVRAVFLLVRGWGAWGSNPEPTD
jgi:hypothetical protein